MNLGELAIKIGVIGDTKKLDQAIDKMEEAEKRTRRLIKYRKDLAKATSDDEKKLIKENFAQQVKLDKMKAQSAAIKKQNTQWLGLAKGIGAVVGAATLAYKVVDRMITSLAQANQQMITFQRTTGISFSSLNKYASANAAVNFNSSIEGTAQSMQRLSQNLWDIQMGRGDVSPYQELAFVGGKAFNPMGMSVEQVIESVRDAIKGVNDLQATNIITRMGFAPDDLMMLRMSREEFEKINDLFLSPQQREEINKYSLELKKINLEFEKTWQLILINIFPVFNKLAKVVTSLFKVFERLNRLVIVGIIKPAITGFKIIGNTISGIVLGVKALTKAFTKTFEILKPILSILKMIGEVIWLPIEDVITYLSGGDSLTGRALEGLSGVLDKVWENIKIPSWAEKLINSAPINTTPLNQNTSNINQNNSIVVNSNQPTAAIVKDYTNNYLTTTGQILSMAQ